MALNTGDKLGPYEVVAPLGAGGMGEVWKARDTRLDRSVAIKVLPEHIAQREDLRARFEREARSVASLSHPHICTLYDIGEDSGTSYMVMELLEGQTLAERIAKGPIPLDQAVPIAIQIADALDRAHRAGVTHRDIKPGNIMLSRDGVKVLDFGLAKSAVKPGPTEATLTKVPTTGGIIMGTPQYMAPEQIQGAEADHRADIFSFGCVLYEMISGNPPFEGKSATSVMAAILERPAPALPAELMQFDWLIQRCLEKDAEARFQSIHDVRLVLERLPSRAVPPRQDAGRRQALIPWLAAGIALLGLAAFAVWKLRPPVASRIPVLTRVTSDPGVTTQPDISPDGKLVVYSSDRDGQNNLDLYLQQIPGGSPARITNTDEDETEPAFSPDGTSIAFCSSKADGGIYIMPTLGGEPRLLVRGGHAPRYSPDGASIAYWTGTLTSGDPFAAGAAKTFSIPSAGGTPQQIHPEFLVARAPIWSPDGQRLLFQGLIGGEEERAARIDYWSTPVSGGSAQRTGLLSGLQSELRRTVHRWTREGVLSTYGRISNLYRIPVDAVGKVSGPPVQLTNGTDAVQFAAASQAGRLVFASSSERVNIWGVPIDGMIGKTTGPPYRITDDLALPLGLSFSPDGRTLLFGSTRNGSMEVWMKDLVGGKLKVFIPGPNTSAPVHLRSGRVAYRKNRNALLFDPSTGESRQISDSGYLYDVEPKEEFGTLRIPTADQAQIDVLDLRTGKSAPLLRAPHWNLYQARFSPDGRWVAFLANITPVMGRIFAGRFRGMQEIPQAEWIPITGEDGKVDKPRFSPDGKLIYFTQDGEGSRSIRAIRFDVENGRPVGDPFLVYDFQGPRLSMVPVNLGPLDLAITRDKLVTLVAESSSNIWMAELNAGTQSASK